MRSKPNEKKILFTANDISLNKILNELIISYRNNIICIKVNYECSVARNNKVR